MCDGSLLSIQQYSALFSLLATTCGSNGRTNFALPDLRGRTIVGAGQGPGLDNYPECAKGGAQSVTLNQNQLQSHTHTLNAQGVQGQVQSPLGKLIAEPAGLAGLKGFAPSSSEPSVAMATAALSSTGNGQAVPTGTP